MDPNTRLLQALFLLKCPDMGSLWWVSNMIWKQNSSFVLKESQQDGKHPGVSILREHKGIPLFIPMLLGTSNRNTKAVTFKLDNSKERLTYFGTLRPVDCALGCFSSEDLVCPNSPKKRLDAAEEKELESFIRGRLK